MGIDQRATVKIGNATLMFTGLMQPPQYIHYRIKHNMYEAHSMMGVEPELLVHKRFIHLYGEDLAVKMTMWGLFKERYPKWLDSMGKLDFYNMDLKSVRNLARTALMNSVTYKLVRDNA